MLMAKSNMTSLVFGCLAILAIGLGLGMRFYDLSSDPGNQHLSGNNGYISLSSSLPRDEKHYVKPPQLEEIH